MKKPRGFQKGHPDLVPPEARKRAGIKISKALKGKSKPWMAGDKNPMKRPEVIAKANASKKGKHYPKLSAACAKRSANPEYRAKLSVGLKGKPKPGLSEAKKGKPQPWLSGEKHWNWQGGITENPYPVEFNAEFRERVRERFDYICVLCKLTQKQVGHLLRVHHIDYDKENLDPNNFVPLCCSCHGATSGRKNRDYWTKCFKSLIHTNLVRVQKT